MLLGTFFAVQVSATTIINMADATPPASGTGWTYASSIYTISNGANVTVTGTNASNRRIAVAANATATITLNNAVIVCASQNSLLLNKDSKVTLILPDGTNKEMRSGSPSPQDRRAVRRKL